MENNENNVQSQVNETLKKPQKSGKKVTIILGIIVLILVLAVGILAGVLISGNGNKIIKQVEEKIVQNDDNKTSKKVDESKPWVYDAEYMKDKEEKEKTSSENKTYKASEEIKLPYININSEDAKKVNEEIKTMFDKAYEDFGKLEEGLDLATGKKIIRDDWFSYKKYKYNAYENNNILSIVIEKYDVHVPGDGGREYIIYNFNLDTLKLATIEEVGKACGFNSESEVKEKVSIVIENEGEEAGILDRAWDGKRIFIDKNGKLSFVIQGPAYGDITLEVDKDVTRKDQAIINQTQEIIQGEDNKENNSTSTNTDISKSDKENIKKFTNANLINIENASIKFVKVNSNVSLSIDLDKDGIEDKIICNPEQNMLSIKLNNHDSQDMIAKDVSAIYVADIDENDKYLDIIIKWDSGSADYVYSIYTFSEQFNQYIHIQYNDGSNIYLEGTKMYIDHKGVVLTQDKCYSAAKEPVSYQYYNLRLFGMIEIPVSTYENRLIEFEDILFTDDLNKIKPISGDSDYNEAINNGDYTYFENIKAYIVGYETVEGRIDRTRIKVRLQDGREGWLFSMDGNLAG